tara:strand:- start:9006 stop:9179 length:174 start_codon:yes stop_codon:yes gene_type:complete
MLGISLLLSFSFLLAFFWASKHKQFGDLVSPAWRAVYDEAEKVNNKQNEGEQHEREV